MTAHLTHAAHAPSFGHAVSWARRQTEDGPYPVSVFGAATATGIQELAAFGHDGGRGAGVDDQFALFSVTKPLTALAAMRLVERGQLSLDAQLSEAVPSLAGEQAGLVTLEQMLSHRSGLADPPLDGDDPRTVLEHATAVFPAGTMTQYCNLGFIGVEKLMERASGTSFESQFAAFTELDGVTTLGFDGDRDPHVVHGLEGVGLDHARMAAARHPAAGAYATATDLLGIGSALLRTVSTGSAEVVHPATLAAMRVNRTHGLPRLNSKAQDAREQDWGLGFNLPQSSSLIEPRIFGHAGWSGTQFWVYPEQGVCFVLMTNLIEPRDYGVRIDELQNAVLAGVG